MYNVVVKKFTFAISSPDEFLVIYVTHWQRAMAPVAAKVVHAAGRAQFMLLKNGNVVNRDSKENLNGSISLIYISQQNELRELV